MGISQTQNHDQPSIAALKLQAEAGSVEAKAKLGSLYFAGEGAPKDLILGSQWSYKAALAGIASAARSVPSAYWEGMGVR